MIHLTTTKTSTHTKNNSEYSSVFRSVSILLIFCLFNYTTLNSANCKSLCKVNEFFKGQYTQLLVIEDDSGESIALPMSECVEDVDTDEENTDSNSVDVDFCSYCIVMSGGTALAADLPLIINPVVPLGLEIIYENEFRYNKPIITNCSQRAPPAIS